jgi:hypothetical protein
MNTWNSQPLIKIADNGFSYVISSPWIFLPFLYGRILSNWKKNTFKYSNVLETAVARGNVVGWGTMLQAGKSRVWLPMRLLDFFNWPNPSNRTKALGSTQPLTEMITRNLPGGKERPARKADLTAICEPIV